MLLRKLRAAVAFAHPPSPHLSGRPAGGGAVAGEPARGRSRRPGPALFLLGAVLPVSVLASDAPDLRAPGAPTAASQRSVFASRAGSNMPLAAPVLGYVWESASLSLRKVEGVPGAALVGLSYLRSRFAAAAVAPNQSSALLTDGNGSLYFSALPAIEAPALLASGLPSSFRISFSPSGQFAVLFAPGATSTFLASGLPGAPSVREVPSLAGIGGISSAIVADSGAVLLARGGSSGVSISYATLSAPLTPVSEVGQLGGMSFLAGTDVAVFSDSVNNNVWKASGIGAAVSLTLVAGAHDGISQPGVLAVSTDNRSLWVASAANTAIFEFSLSVPAAPAKQMAGPFAVTGLARLSGNSVFALEGAASGALFVLDGDWPAGRIVQVPVTPLPRMLGGIQ